MYGTISRRPTTQCIAWQKHSCFADRPSNVPSPPAAKAVAQAAWLSDTWLSSRCVNRWRHRGQAVRSQSIGSNRTAFWRCWPEFWYFRDGIYRQLFSLRRWAPLWRRSELPYALTILMLIRLSFVWGEALPMCPIAATLAFFLLSTCWFSSRRRVILSVTKLMDHILLQADSVGHAKVNSCLRSSNELACSEFLRKRSSKG